jgi:tetratricopeptide (TPR) repeat protein
VLFDLKGRRRRVVQATYLTLAVLMGGGLVFFGIGGDVSGGLFDAFSDRSGGSGNDIVEERIDDNEKKLETDPENKAALEALVRDWYSLASPEADPTTGQFTDEGKERLAEADEAWQRYLDLDLDKPDASVAVYMIEAYGPGGLNKPEEAVKAAEVITAANPKSAQAFVQLAQYAALAGDKRKADLAGQRAIDVASKDERTRVKQIVKQLSQLAPPASTTTTPSE